MPLPDHNSTYRDDVLLKEYLRLCDEIRNLETSNDRIVGVGVSFVALIAAAGVAKDIQPIFVILPFAMLGLFFYGVWNYRHVYSIAGYKKMLEELLNDRVGEHLLLWEKLAPERRKGDVIRFGLFFIYLLAATVITILSVGNLVRWMSPIWGEAVGMLSIVLYVLLIFCLRIMWRTMDQTYIRSKQLYAEGLRVRK